MKYFLYIALIVIIGLGVFFGMEGPWGSTTEDIHDKEEGAVMHQIEPPKAVFQAGTSPLGASESETGYAREDGTRHYPGKEEPEMVKFEMEAEESDSTVKTPKIEVVDEDGNPVSDEEIDEIFEDIYPDEE